MKNERHVAEKIISILKLLVLLLILVGIPVWLMLFHRDTILEFRDLEAMKSLLRSHSREGGLVYLALQILQIVISFLPGQPLQIAAGYLYGFLNTVLLSWLGAGIGTVLSYYLAKLLGRDSLKLFFRDETIDRYIQKLNSKRSYIIVFFLYLIPGLPKDIISYAAGISNMRFKAFLPISLIGRTPAMCVSILVGTALDSEQYWAVGGMAVLMAGIFLVCVLKRRELNRFLDRVYEKLSS